MWHPKLEQLSPYMQGKAVAFVDACKKAGMSDVLIICTYRSAADQQAAFDAHLSMCKPGMSAHNAVDAHGNPCAEAFDIGIIRNGKYVGDGEDPDYAKAGAIGESVGLAWSGRWKGKLQEVGHFQNPTWKGNKK